MLLKNPAVEIIKVDTVEWSSLSFFPVLYSCHFLSLSATLLSSFHLLLLFFFLHLLSSYLTSSLLVFCVYFVSSPVWTDMCSLTMGTTSPSSANSAPLNLPTWAAWRATCIRHTQVKTDTQTHRHTHTHTHTHTLNHILQLYPWLIRYSRARIAASCLSSFT